MGRTKKQNKSAEKKKQTDTKSGRKRKVTTETAETEQPEAKQPREDEESEQDVTKSEEKIADEKPDGKMVRATNSSQLKGSVIWSVYTGMVDLEGANLSVGRYITMITTVLGRCHLMKYDLQGKHLQTVKLKHWVVGITEATLAGKQCLAVSYGSRAKKAPSIEFLDLRDVKKSVFVYSAPAHKPHSLFWIQPSTLMYQDCSEEPFRVRSLDCSTSPPKQTEHSITDTESQQVTDLCCVLHRDDQVIVATCKKDRLSTSIYAFSMRSNRLSWKIVSTYPRGGDWPISFQGVTTDGRGHLFVCDTFCTQDRPGIQVFYVDGTHLGSLLMFENVDYILGSVRWSEETSSLIVLHRMRGDLQTVISSIKVQRVDKACPN